jgi:hypothetical protein
MPPEFSKATKEVLGKRAAFLCSNPDCRTTTAGPTSDPLKALNIGEAAHIFGAYPGAARFREEMSDGARAEITNGIWLCRNCHKLIDNDPVTYLSDILYRWRSDHELYVAQKVGNKTELIRWEVAEQKLHEAFRDNLLAKQIAREKLPGWEYRLIAELLRSRLDKPAREWAELKGNLRVSKLTPLPDEDVIRWFQVKLAEGMAFVGPLTNLYSVELEKSWGPPGIPGDEQAISRVCSLIAEVAVALVHWEEDVRFVWVSEIYRPLLHHMRGIMGRNLEKLLEMPSILDEGIDHAEAHPNEQTVIEHTLVFDLPDGWADAIGAELERIQAQL